MLFDSVIRPLFFRRRFVIYLLVTISVHVVNPLNQILNDGKTKDYFEDLNSDTSKSPSIETLLQYEIELKNMLETIRSQIDTIVNREIDAENEYVEHNRLIRDISQVESITNDALSNATNASFTLYFAQNTTTVTTIPVVFRLLNVLTGTTPDANPFNSTSATATNDNQTSSIQPETSTTSSSTIKQTVMADKPDVQQTKGVLGDPKVGDFTPPPFLEPFRNGRQVGLSDLLLNVTKCTQLTEEQLVKELKQQGTYNPDFMAWDVRGVLNFFEKASTDSYDKVKKVEDRSRIAEQNLAAIEALVKELNLKNCNLRAPDVLAKLYNFSLPRSTFEQDSDRLRTKRDQDNVDARAKLSAYETQTKYLFDLYSNEYKDDSSSSSSNSQQSSNKKDKKSSDSDQDIIGQVHVVPFGCRKRGTAEDGYLRLCGACQAIRRLPDNFFPPFINEVTCDEDKACLYFYDYPHGKCKQKHLNFVVLQNIGTSDCQLWRRFNLNVRVSCECFVDEMSFFAKYV